MTDKFITIMQVRERTSLSKTEIYRRIAAGTFPTPSRLAAGAWSSERATSRPGCRPKAKGRKLPALLARAALAKPLRLGGHSRKERPAPTSAGQVPIQPYGELPCRLHC